MKYFSVLYLSLLHEYSDKDAQRPFATEAGMVRIKEEESMKLLAQLMSKVKR